MENVGERGYPQEGWRVRARGERGTCPAALADDTAADEREGRQALQLTLATKTFV